MNSRAFRLPGERDLWPGEPDTPLKQLGGPVTLESFRFIHGEKLSWHRDLPIVFALELFCRSQARRIKAGTSKLLFEAARATLKTFERELHRMYAARGWLSYLPDELADALAKQLAEEAKSNTSIKDEIAKQLRLARDAFATDELFELIPSSIRCVLNIETVEESFSRWSDYFEYAKSLEQYAVVLGFHRFIVTCARINDAVFGTSILCSTAS